MACFVASIVPRRLTRQRLSHTSTSVCSSERSLVLESRVSAALLCRTSRPPNFAIVASNMAGDGRFIAEVDVDGNRMTTLGLERRCVLFCTLRS